MGAVCKMSWIQAYGIFIGLLIIFTTKTYGNPMARVQNPKWRPFNSIMKERYMPFLPEDSPGSNPVALHVQGYPQEENDMKDFESNLRSAVRDQLSTLIDMKRGEIWPDYNGSQKRRFMPQQLIG